MLRALQQGPFDPLQTVELKFLSDSAPACIGLHQEGRGPARIFGRRFVPRVWAGPGNPEAPAWLCAQGSHYSLQGPGGEPASCDESVASPLIISISPSLIRRPSPGSRREWVCERGGALKQPGLAACDEAHT